MDVQVIDALKSAVGQVWSGSDIPERYHKDWSGLSPVQPIALVRPTSAQEVSAVMKLASAMGVPVVPQGGLTGLAGGAHPIAGAIVLSLDRMNAIEEVDPVMACITVQAGVALETIQKAADEVGLMFPLDLGARGSAQIGGNLSTNAGGNRVIRYGMARDQVLGLEVVLPDGTIVTSLNKLIKNNAGYDLKQLFLGSEGTLGIITRAVLRLQAKPKTVSTIFCGCRDFDAVLGLLEASRGRLGPMLTAFEAMWPQFYDFMTGGLPYLRRPLAQPHGAYVLIEASGFDPEHDGELIETIMGEFIEAGLVEDAVVAASEKDVKDLWAVRDSVSEFTKLMGPNTGFDVGLPAGAMRPVVDALMADFKAKWPDGILLVFGHVGDSNLHIVGAVPSAGSHQPHDEISDLVFRHIRGAGGTISAEHGIGLLKKPYLPYSRTPEELALMATIKKALDPKGVLNPGKVVSV